MSDGRHEFNPTVQRDFLLSLIERQLGVGISRRVFTMRLREDLVLKLEDGTGRFQNVLEWETWQQASGTELARWLAPCEWISSCATVLAMKRTLPAQPKQFPARLPRFLTDTKRDNYGIFDGRLVCHDYGTNIAIAEGLTSRTRKAAWWDA